MGTTRNPLAGRYFNDPNIAVGLSNLAAAFAPPSAEEYLLAEQVKGERLTNQAMNDLYVMADGNPDILGGILTGGWTPTQGFEAMRGGLANERRGQDITAETARLNNASDNERMLRLGVLDAAVNPAGRQAISDEDLMATIGLEGVPGFGMAGPVAPTDAQVMGQNMTRLQESGQLTDDMLVASVMSDTPVEMIDTPQGPQFQYRSDAVGQTAYVNQGGKAAADLLNYVTPDGREGSAIFDPNTQQLKDAATGAPLPAGSTTFKLQGGDRNAVVGATTSNTTAGNQAVADAEYGLGRLANFRTLLEQNPGVLGIPGKIRGYAQDVVAAANEMGAAYGTIDNVEELYSLAERVGAKGGYDPAIAQAMAYALEMAYLQAKMQDPGGEVNVRELDQLLGVYDGGIAGNAKVLSNLDVLEGQLNDRIRYGNNLRQGAPGGASGATPAPQLTPDDLRYLETP